jgi:F0F1-type ATP synthase membrane subunit b/b'
MEEEAIERATGEAQGEIERLKERGRKELVRIRGTARENMDQAVKRIMEEL